MRIGLGAIWCGAALAELSVLAALPSFRFGAFVDAEPAAVVFFAAAALCLFGLTAMLPRHRLARAALCHPLFLLPLAVGIWSMAVAPLAEFPLLSLLGPVQSSQGALWYVAAAAFFAAFLVLGRLPKARCFHLCLLSVVVLAIGILHLPQAPLVSPLVSRWLDAGWAPFGFSKYLAYYAFPLLLVGGALVRRQRWPAALALVAGALATVASSNLTAGLILAVLAPLTLVLQMLLRRLSVGTKLWSGLAVACVVIGAASYPLIREVPPGGALKTIWSRAILGRAIEPTLHQPVTWIAGKGWGHYSQELVRNLSAADISLFNSEWEEVNRDEFHSHNAGLEALFSAGLIGAILIVLWPVALIRQAQPRYGAALAGLALSLVALDALWFQLPVTVAAGAMGAGFLVRRGRARRLPVPAAAVGVALLALAPAAAAAATLRHAVQVEQWKACLHGGPSGAGLGCAALPSDPRQSRLGEGYVLNELLMWQQAAAPSAPPAPVPELLRQAVSGGTELVTGAGLTFALALNNAYGTWSLRAPLQKGEGAKWEVVVAHLQSAAPRRPDLIIPYVNWLIEQKRETGAGIVVERSALAWPDHPVVLWYRGFLMLANPANTQQGIGLMKRALAGGIERYQPIPPDIKAALAP